MKSTEKIVLGFILVLVLFAGSMFANANFNQDLGSEGTIDDDSDELMEKQESMKLAPLAKLSQEQAKEIARTVISNEPITDVELEKENGVIVYAVEFTKDGIETDVKLDATTGKILKIEKDVPGSDADLVWEFD